MRSHRVQVCRRETLGQGFLARMANEVPEYELSLADLERWRDLASRAADAARRNLA